MKLISLRNNIMMIRFFDNSIIISFSFFLWYILLQDDVRVMGDDVSRKNVRGPWLSLVEDVYNNDWYVPPLIV